MLFNKFVLLFFIVFININILQAQNNNQYDSHWHKVAALETKDLTKSALNEVMDIYKQAKKSNNNLQQVKAAMFQIKYRNMLQNDSWESNILFVDTLISTSTTPVKNILQNMQAEMFWQYLQKNRYKLYGRTELANEKSKDISTWGAEKLNITISDLFEASIGNDEILQSTSINGFDNILKKGENTRNLRPTLFDLLAFRAFNFFESDENRITHPAYQFVINDANAFAPASQFIATSYITKDTNSYQHKALLLLQKLLAFHLKDIKPDALLDADLIRLNFINQHSVNADKNELYEKALMQLEKKYAGNAIISQAMYLRAQLYFNRGQSYVPFTATTHQYEIKRAKELCDSASSLYPESIGAINAQNLSKQILLPSVSMVTEIVNQPGQPWRTLVNYKNVAVAYFRIIPVSKEQIKKLNSTEGDQSWQDLLDIKPIKSWQVNMPDPKDFQAHATEIKVDALPVGMYYIIASLNEKFNLQKNIIAKQLTYVSNISIVNNNRKDYYILNRENGKPFFNASVQTWQTSYNEATRQNVSVKAENYTSDINGHFSFKSTTNSRNITFQVKTENDELFTEDYIYDNYYDGFSTNNPKRNLTFLFTDRSIYRPGQIIYFKGIILRNDSKSKETAILPSFKTSIQLRDANNQKVNELSIITNDFGSYHGTFKLPEGTLNGQFSLFDTATNTAQYFNVEEYKRPKFFVEIKKPTGTYKLLDSIKIIGSAKGYSGNNIDGALVNYRVVRKVRYPIWLDYINANNGRKTFPGYGRSNGMEITNGKSTTDAKGIFQIIFKALPDESIDKKNQPIFYYEVSADVTDINGETRSSNTSVAVAYQMLQLEIKVPDQPLADNFKSILVKSTNLNDLEEKTSVKITIQQLQSPSKIFRERFWPMPDQFTMSKNEYYDNFPYDIYKDENEVKNYAPLEMVFDKLDSTNQIISLKNNLLKAGWYKIVATSKDKNGEPVIAEKYLQLVTKNDSGPIVGAVQIIKESNSAQPGEKIKYTIQTGFNEIWMVHSLLKKDSLMSTTYKTISAKHSDLNEINITENDRGGMVISYVFVQHNRIYEGLQNFEIPWNNKELKIEYATFRDKLLPGSNEKWKLKISGNKGEKVVAEILASMYDASLDQFKQHNWTALNIWPTTAFYINWNGQDFSRSNSQQFSGIKNYFKKLPPKSYDNLLFSNGEFFADEVVVIGYASRRQELTGSVGAINPMDMVFTNNSIASISDHENVSKKEVEKDSTAINVTSLNILNQPKVRTNFNETAFFLPDLKTDAACNVEFSFTIPEALTQWKLMTFAHTKNLASAYTENLTVTQKPLMVQPNAPRFLREGDGLEFSAKIVNLSDKEITGTTQLELFDAANDKPIDGWFKNVFSTQYFTVAAGQSVGVKFPIEIPFNFNSALTYRIVAKSANHDNSNNFSDGEEMSIPILTNRTLVTETLPINLRNQASRSFSFDKLIKSGGSETLTSHGLTVEYTSNPAWYAVQALPYLMEYPYECAEQTFNRFYANALAGHIINTMPKIKEVFEKYRTTDTAALLSNLQKNEELKSALLQETPWVVAAQNETAQKKNIALLFDMVKMNAETQKAISKLKDMQSNSGGFVWFKGGQDDRYITQYILTGIGHLKKLKAFPADNSSQSNAISGIVNNALPYMDKKVKEEYDDLIKVKANLKNNNLNNSIIQYLYMRSFFKETNITLSAQVAYKYYLDQIKKYWLNNSKYLQAMIALTLHRNSDLTTPHAIIKSLKENSIIDEELGMYWKEWNNGGYYWYQAPVESQALMIEAFTDIDKNISTVNDLKTWLLKQKQTQNWKTTKATAEAVYALLLDGSNELSVEKSVSIQLGNTTIKSTDDKTEAGTGYFKKSFTAKNISPDMGNIKVTSSITNPGINLKPNGGASWGAVYWQYFEDLDKITNSSTPLKLTKTLFIEKNTDHGPELTALTDGATLKIGDKVKVRIGLKVDRDMEYLHMKDMRAACMEPTNVISEYKWQGGLGYYQSTADASTNFFFGSLPRGSFIFEYDLFVTTVGNFSNGITTIQCMYAPEFTSHSEGIRVTVEVH